MAKAAHFEKAGHGLALVLVLATVASFAYIPHLDTFRQGPDPDGGLVSLGQAVFGAVTGERDVYNYTVHVDENLHWVRTANIQRHDKILAPDPYTGQERSSSEPFSLRGAVHEVGFLIILAEINELTGVPFLRMLEFLPAVWLAFTGFCVYALMRGQPGALAGAALVGLLPTTVRFLGPAFAVPIAFVLPWILMTLLLAYETRARGRMMGLLAIVLVWAFFVHLIGGFAAVVVLVAFAFQGVQGTGRRFAQLILIAAIPLLWLYQAFNTDVQVEVEREEFLPIDFTIFLKFGILTLLAWATGCILLAGAKERTLKSRTFATASIASMMILALILMTVLGELNRYATYARWHHPFFILACLPASYAIGRLASVGARFWTDLTRSPTFGRTISAMVIGTFTAISLQAGAGYHLAEPYYQVVQDEDWQAFQDAARRNATARGSFIAHPWKAPVLNAMDGAKPFSWLNPGSPPFRGREYEELARHGATVDFYILNGITVVFPPIKPPTEIYEKTDSGFWQLKPEYSFRLLEQA